MSRGKHLSLEEARQLNQLERFAKENPATVDKERFLALLDAMSQGVLEGEETAPKDRGEGSSATRIPRDT